MLYNKLVSCVNYFRHADNFPSGHDLYFGNRGSGKSTNIAKDFYKFAKGKTPFKHFYSNQDIKCDNPNFHLLDLNLYQLTDYLDPDDKVVKKYNLSTVYKNKKFPPFYIQPYSVIEIDEVGALYNNRNFKSFPQEINNFMKMIRKLHIRVVMYSQTYDCDKQLRQSAEHLYLMKKILLWSVIRKINKKVGIIESKNVDGTTSTSDQNIGDIVSIAPILEPGAIKINFIPFYTDLFNSYE